jgi:alkylation response protein AidB-like acyl-CoA dehydrogenase
VVPFSTPPGVPYASPLSVAEGRVRGRVTSVADALPAEMLLVVADGGVYLVAADDPGVRREPVTSLDMTRPLCDVSFDGARAERIGEAAGLERALLVGSALLAAEQLGLAERCLELTVAYVKERRQFGRPVGSYQGLKHRLAELWVAVTQARAVARYAAACAAAADADLPVAAAVAQAHCGPVAVRAAEECVQMHGGIGFTWEHPAHLYLKRAKSASLAFGSASRHRATLAGLVDLPL